MLATRKTHTVREFVEEAFLVLGEEIAWKRKRKGTEEKGYLKSNQMERLISTPIDGQFSCYIKGDSTKAYEKL